LLIKGRLPVKCWEFSRKLGNRIFRGCVPSIEKKDVDKKDDEFAVQFGREWHIAYMKVTKEIISDIRACVMAHPFTLLNPITLHTAPYGIE